MEAVESTPDASLLFDGLPVMDHLNYEFNAALGDTAEVALDRAANVMLMDSSNYMNYRSKKKFQYYGGHVQQSPFQLTIPRDGLWHVVVDLGGGPGQVRASVSLLSGTPA